MKRTLLPILLAVLLLPAALSVGGCAGRVGLGVDTFASLPAAASVVTPDEAEIALYALIVKIVAPAKELATAEHSAGRFSDAKFEKCANAATLTARFASSALVAIDKWRAPGGSNAEFSDLYARALLEAQPLLEAVAGVKK